MDDCIFCKIIRGEIPSAKVYEDEETLAFKDIAPHAKVHILFIPKTHFKTFAEMDEENAQIVSRMLQKIPTIAAQNGCKGGYRLIVNQGEDAGQTVPHLHFHILGGETLPWD